MSTTANGWTVVGITERTTAHGLKELGFLMLNGDRVFPFHQNLCQRSNIGRVFISFTANGSRTESFI